MVIIAILAALLFGVAGAAMNSAKRNRAAAEIAAFEVALTRFETENGFVPPIPFITNTVSGNATNYTASPTDATYLKASRALFFALTGRTKFDYDAASGTNGTAYIDLKDSQVASRSTLGETNLLQNDSASYTNSANYTAGSYITDPWKQAYGYFYNDLADPQSVHNSTRPDLWSTAGETNASPAAYIYERWLSNWARR